MGFLIRLFAKRGFFLFFVFIEAIAVVLIFRKNAIQQSFIAAQTSAINSAVSGYIDEGTSYLKLRQINQDLVSQNKALMLQLYGRDSMSVPVQENIDDTENGQQIYTIMDAEVISNSINRADNYFTINRGEKQGVKPEMGVITPRGIAGIVINTTGNFAVVQSVLSIHNIRINAALKKSGYFGTLTWKGDSPRLMHLSDIPKYVNLNVGDTVVTDNKSTIFPKGIMIGRVAGYEIDPKTSFWDVAVELSEDMGNVQKAYVVSNLRKVEIKQIQDTLKKVRNGK